MEGVTKMNSQFTIAIHCILLLGMSETGMAKSEDMAVSVCTHPARIRKVLGLLRKHGYVTTKEGASGGYRLQRREENIRLGDLYRLLSKGWLQPKWCSGSTSSGCSVSEHIPSVMAGIYAGSEETLIRYLDTITLADIRVRIQAGEADSIQ
jgi:Rrf2 family protein